MSAYFVSKATIDLMISAAIELKMYASFGHDHGPVTAARADMLGKMLWQANAESLGARYGDRASDYAAEIDGYRWTQYVSITNAAIIGCARSFDYQACETDTYRGSDAHEFAMRLQAEVGKKLAGEGPWGVDDLGNGSDYDIAKYARKVRNTPAPAPRPVRAPCPVAPASNVVAIRPAPAPKAAPIKPAGFDNFRARLQARIAEAKPARKI